MKQSKELKKTKMAKVFYICPTTYENDTFWVSYDLDGKYGREVVNRRDLDSYKMGSMVAVEDKYSLDICSKELEEMIRDCDSSDLEMLYVNIGEMPYEDVMRIKNEVSELDAKYEDLKISDYFEFYKRGLAITVYGDISTRFLF